MTSVGSVQVSVRLGLQQLQSDAKKAQADLAKALDDVTVKVTTDGLKEATQQFNNFKKAAGGGLGDIVPKSSGASITELARTLNTSFKEAKNFASGLGLSANQASAAISTIQNLNSVNASSVEKFRVLARELGINKQQFLALEQTVTSITPKLRGVGTGTEIAQLAQNLASTYREAQNFARGIGLSASQTNTAIAAINRLNATNATAAEKFRVLKTELGVSKQQFRELDAAVNSTNAKLQEAATGVNAFIQGIAQGVGQQVISQVFLTIQRGIGAILGVIPASIQSFLQLDGAIRQTGVISGASVEDLAELRAEVERLGLVTSKTPREIGAVTTALARAGFTAKEQVAALEGIVRASEATGDGLEQVGDIIGKTLRVFSLAADESQRVADALVATANNTNSSVVGIGESLAYVGPVAAAANQPLEDTLVLLGLLGDQGIQGSMAGTNLAAALERLKVASAGGQTEFENLVKGSKKSTEAFEAIGTEVRNADGSMKSLLEVLPILQENMKQLGQADKDVLFKSLFGVEGGRAIQALLNTTPERIGLVTQKVKEAQGVAVQSGEAMLQGLGGALSLLEGSIQTFTAELGSSFAPAAEVAVKAVIPLVNESIKLLDIFNDLPGPVKAVLLSIGGFAAALAGAVVSLTAYNLLLEIGIVAHIKDSAATIANAAAKAKNTAATSLLTIAEGARAVATGQATLATIASTQAMNAALIAAGKLLLVFAALGAAVAAAKWLNYVNDVRETNEALDELEMTANAAADGALNAAGRTKQAVSEVQQARKEGRSLTDEETAAIQRLTAANDLRISQIDEELAGLQALKAEVESQPQSDATKAQLNSIEALIGSTQRSRDVLNNQNELLKDSTTVLGDNASAAEEATSAIDTLTASYTKTGNAAKVAASEAKAALAEAFAAGDINQEQFDQGILDAEADFLSQRLEQNRAFLMQLKDLQAVTQDPADLEKIGQQIFQIEEQIAGDRLAIAQQSADARVQAEEEAAQKILDALDQQSADIQTRGDVQTGGLDIESQRISEQQSLLSAQNDLLSAQFGIREQNLQSAIDAAEADENTAEAARLRNQLEQERDGFLELQFENQRQQLELTQQQKALDLERQRILAEIAVAEAEINIEKARAEGASAAEIANLEKILGLRQDQLASIDESIANQEKVNDLEDKTLTANEELERLKNSQVEAREKEAEKLEEIKKLEDELRQARAAAQKSQNDAAVSSAEAELEANPSASNLNKLQDAREKALQDEFANRQAELDAESKARIGAAEEEAKAAADAYNTALEEFNTGQAAALEDGSISAEEQERLDLLQEQNDQAREQVDAANEQLGLEQQIADAKQQQLNTDKKAAIEAEKAKQKKETEDARAAGLLSGVQGGDVNTLTAARNQLRQITDQVNKFGPGRQIQELLNFARQDSRFKGNGGQFNDVLLNQLGGLGQAALNLEAIAKSGDAATAQALAQQLDRAQATGDSAGFEALAQKVAELAAKAGPITINASAPDPIGAAGAIVRDIRAGDSKARGL